MLPETINSARPSTMADLPTPGSPINTGLFLVRRDRICTMRSISCARPITGSNSPATAAWVRSRENWSSTGVFSFFAPPGAFPPCSPALTATKRSSRALFRSTPSFTSTWAATPSRSCISASSRCSVPT